MEQQKPFEHKDILQLIFDALPKPYMNGKALKMDPIKLKRYSVLSGQIFQIVVDYLLNEKRTMHLRNKVILEKATYDKLVETSMIRGSTIGAQTVLNRFKNKGFWSRIRCAWTGNIN